MPLLALPAFNRAHARPHILFADLAPPLRRQTRYALLTRLADLLNLRGDYTLVPEGASIRVAIADDVETAEVEGFGVGVEYVGVGSATRI